MADLNITSQKELKNWLMDKPSEWSQVIALRSASRILPVVLDPTQYNGMMPDPRLALAVLRAIAVSSAAVRNTIYRSTAWSPVQESVTSAAAVAFAAAAESVNASASAYDAAYSIAAEVDSGDHVDTVISSVNSAAYAAYAFHADDDQAANAAVAAIWRAVSRDCIVLDEFGAPRALANRKLWPVAPSWLKKAWNRSRSWMEQEGHWSIWSLWFDGVLEGQD